MGISSRKKTCLCWLLAGGSAVSAAPLAVEPAQTSVTGATEAERPAWTANVTFRLGNKSKKRRKRQYLHQVHSVFDLEVETPEEVRQRLSPHSSSSKAAPAMAALRTSRLEAAAAIARSQLRVALAEAELSSEELREVLDNNFKKYFDPETDELRSDVLSHGPRANLLRTLRLVLRPVCDAARAAASDAVLPCPASHVHCGVWDWYLRGMLEGSGPDVDYFSSMHLDGKLMLGKQTRRTESTWGVSRGQGAAHAASTRGNAVEDAWWNLWVLLSEDAGTAPLLLLEPDSWNLTSFRESRSAFPWPLQDFRQDGVSLRFRTPRDMHQGDMLLFRSDDVAHGTGLLVNASTGLPAATSSSAHKRSRRVSFDARCHCVPFSIEPEITERGELCAPSWHLGSSIVHGCLRTETTSSRPWCVIRRKVDDAGAGCVLQDGSLCEHPCRRLNLCTSRRFDYCT
mmetsp:Transcript_144951/g.255493  ORF Transcript_144951/g.255493 Transcript_144951/m.255493 type:complete len:456 (-) Transcript_144951:22-1389(-)